MRIIGARIHKAWNSSHCFDRSLYDGTSDIRADRRDSCAQGVEPLDVATAFRRDYQELAEGTVESWFQRLS